MLLKTKTKTKTKVVLTECLGEKEGFGLKAKKMMGESDDERAKEERAFNFCLSWFSPVSERYGEI